MLKELNRFTARHGFAVGLLLFVILVGPLVFIFGSGGCDNLRGSLFSGETMGDLQGRPVTNEDIKHHIYAFGLQRVLYSGEPIDLNALFQGNRQADYLPMVISRMRLLRFAEESGWAQVTEASLAEYKKGLPCFMVDNKYSSDKYIKFKEYYLKKQPISLLEFNQICMENIAIQRVNTYLSSATVSTPEMRADLLTSQGDLDYVIKTFDKSSFKGEPVTDEAIKDYYENHKGGKLKLPDRIRAKLAVFSVEARPDGAKPVTDEELKAKFAERNPGFEVKASHILVAYKGAERAAESITRTEKDAEKRAKELAKKAKADDADFAELAKENSDGPSKDRGGDLGFFPRHGRGAMAEAFGKAAYGMKAGEVSDPVETSFGFHVIKVTEVRPLTVTESFENARAKLRAEMIREADTELWEKAAKKTYDRDKKTKYSKKQARIGYIRIAKKTKADEKEQALDRNQVETIHKDALKVKDLAKFAEELKKTSKSLELYHRVSSFQSLTTEKGQPYILAGLKLKKGEVGPLVEDDKGYYIIQKTEERDEQPFDDVKMNLVFKERFSAQQKARKEASAKITAMLTQLNKTPLTGPKALVAFVAQAKKAGAKLVDTPYLSPSSDKMIEIMGGVKAASILSQLSGLTTERPISKELNSGRDYLYVACLTDTDESREPTLEEAKPEIVKTLEDANALKKARETAKALKDSLMVQLDKGIVPKVLDTFEAAVDYSGMRDRSRIPEKYSVAETLSGSTALRSLGYGDLESGAILVFVKGREKRELKDLNETLESRMERMAGTGGDNVMQFSKILEDKYEFIPDPRYAELFQSKMN